MSFHGYKNLTFNLSKLIDAPLFQSVENCFEFQLAENKSSRVAESTKVLHQSYEVTSSSISCKHLQSVSKNFILHFFIKFGSSFCRYKTASGQLPVRLFHKNLHFRYVERVPDDIIVRT